MVIFVSLPPWCWYISCSVCLPRGMLAQRWLLLWPRTTRFIWQLQRHQCWWAFLFCPATRPPLYVFVRIPLIPKQFLMETPVCETGWGTGAMPARRRWKPCWWRSPTQCSSRHKCTSAEVFPSKPFSYWHPFKLLFLDASFRNCFVSLFKLLFLDDSK